MTRLPPQHTLVKHLYRIRVCGAWRWYILISGCRRKFKYIFHSIMFNTFISDMIWSNSPDRKYFSPSSLELIISDCWWRRHGLTDVSCSNPFRAAAWFISLTSSAASLWGGWTPHKHYQHTFFVSGERMWIRPLADKNLDILSRSSKSPVLLSRWRLLRLDIDWNRWLNLWMIHATTLES